MKKLVSCAAILASLSVAGVAMADETTAPQDHAKDQKAQSNQKAQADQKEQRGIVQLPTSVITGRYQRPLASIEVSRMQPALTIAELKIPLVERIETAIYSTLF